MARIAALCLLCALTDHSDLVTESLTVTTSVPQPLALVNGSVLLHCGFTPVSPVRAQDVGVQWTVTGGGRSPTFLYVFNGSNIKSLRPDVSMDLRLLDTGNASLHLPLLSLRDEGDYTCTVMIGPEVGAATLQLRLAAPPAIALIPDNPRLASGEMKTFLCRLRHFYPKEIEIKWTMRKEEAETVLTKDVCTGGPSRDPDGTFTADSQVSIVFSREDDGSTVRCEVRHKSLPELLRRDATIHLSADGPGPGMAALGVSLSLVVMMLISAIAVLYWKFLASVPPRVSPLILPELLLAGEGMVAICNINGFRPRAVDIRWYIERRGAGGGEETTPCGAGGGEETTLCGAGGGEETTPCGEEPLLTPTDITCRAQHPTTKHGSLFNATSQLWYTPSVQDDGATLVCVVRHKALGAASRRESRMEVAARPKHSAITGWPQDPRRGEPLTLSCVVERFYPKPIAVTWLRNGQAQSGATHFGPFPCEDEYYSVWSQMVLTLSEEEEGAQYTCQIRHRSLPGLEELSYEINARGSPPEVQFISADPVPPLVGQELLLSCRISNFYPREIAVDWSRDGGRLDGRLCHTLCATDTTGAHSMWSFLRVTPAPEDDGSVFMCSVQHAALRNREDRTYTLRVHQSPAP